MTVAKATRLIDFGQAIDDIDERREPGSGQAEPDFRSRSSGSTSIIERER